MSSLGSAQNVSAVLQTLLKEGVLRTNIPKLSAFSGEMAKEEVSFEQWSYELQTLYKSYSDSALGGRVFSAPLEGLLLMQSAIWDLMSHWI